MSHRPEPHDRPALRVWRDPDRESSRDLSADMTLRVWRDPDRESSRDLSADMTLREFALDFYFPHVLQPSRRRSRQRDDKTVRAVRESINYWAAITGDPPLHSIRDCDGDTFVDALERLPGRRRLPAGQSRDRADYDLYRTICDRLQQLGETPLELRWDQFCRLAPMSAATAHKHVRQVQPILDRAGPPGQGRLRTAAGLLDRVPWIEPPAVPREAPEGDYTVAEIERLLAAAPRMTRPHFPDCSPPAWWTSLCVVGYYTGLRIGTLLELRYEWLSGNSIVIPAAAMKRKEKGQRKPLHPDAAAAIEMARTDRELIFPWPFNRRLMSSLLIEWESLAGIAHKPFRAFSGFRKAHATEIASLDLRAAQIALNHGDMRTTLGHYVNQRVHSDAIQNVRRIKPPEDDRQRRLFD